MDKKQPPSDIPGKPSQAETGIDDTRRKLTKAGMASVPVILTLKSQPVWATGRCTISGMLSGNLSNPDAEESCEGCPSHYWKKHPETWPAPYEPGTCDQDNDMHTSPPYEGSGSSSYGSGDKSGGDHMGSSSTYDNNPGSSYDSDGTCLRYNSDGTRFHDVFTGDNRYGDHTMMQVMHLADQDDLYKLGAEACAALLNAETGMNYGYTSRQVVELYNEYCQSEPEALKNTCEMLNDRQCPHV